VLHIFSVLMILLLNDANFVCVCVCMCSWNTALQFRRTASDTQKMSFEIAKAGWLYRQSKWHAYTRSRRSFLTY